MRPFTTCLIKFWFRQFGFWKQQQYVFMNISWHSVQVKVISKFPYSGYLISIKIKICCITIIKRGWSQVTFLQILRNRQADIQVDGQTDKTYWTIKNNKIYIYVKMVKLRKIPALLMSHFYVKYIKMS